MSQKILNNVIKYQVLDNFVKYMSENMLIYRINSGLDIYMSSGIRGTRTTYLIGDGWCMTGRLRGGESRRLRLSRRSRERERVLERDLFGC